MMSRALWVVFVAALVFSRSGSAQELAFGSETWRGHVFQIDQGPLACRVFSHFGNGDRISFTAGLSKGSSSVTLMMFIAPASFDTGGPAAPTSVEPVLQRQIRAGQAMPTPRAWVDDDQDNAVQGGVTERLLTLSVGMLDTPRAAKFFSGLRDGKILRVAVGGEERRYTLRGSFAALSELVGCALKARDGEVAPSSGLPSRPPSPQVAAAPTPDPPAPKQVAAAVPVPPVRSNPRRLASTGSGIVVTTEGHILTNHHVIEGCLSLAVRSVGESEQSAVILAKDVQNDLALVRAARSYREAATLRIEPPRLAESVLVYGFPLSSMLASSGNVTLGSVSALTGLRDDSRAIQITAAVQPGNSGGPVFDGSGLLLGVVQSKLNAMRVATANGDIAQNVNFAIRASLAASFMGANGIEPAYERRRAALPADDVSDRVQKITVQVLCYEGGQ